MGHDEIPVGQGTKIDAMKSTGVLTVTKIQSFKFATGADPPHPWLGAVQLHVSKAKEDDPTAVRPQRDVAIGA